jgi:hypothetical protein
MAHVASSRGLLCFAEDDRVWPAAKRVGLCYWNDPHFITFMSSLEFDYVSWVQRHQVQLGVRFIWENRR